MEKHDVMEAIASLCKRRGFIYQGSEIYGGLAGTWDYGPLGVMLKNNVKGLWWKRFVTDRDDMYGMDAAILMNQRAWVASGHVGGFSDPLTECTECKKRFRVDHLVNEDDYASFINAMKEGLGDQIKKIDNDLTASQDIINYVDSGIVSDYQRYVEELEHIHVGVKSDLEQADNIRKDVQAGLRYVGPLPRYFLNYYVDCPSCGKRKWSEGRQFNMMFKTNVGAIESDESISYLRPETAQGMFVNFKNVVDTFHPKLPFGLAQIGKAFRNEIAPRDFIFRTREFEQMEIEYFVKPEQWETVFEEFRQQVHAYTNDIGLSPERVHELEVAGEDRAHYSKRTIDFEFDYPFGKKELYGLAYRTDFDLSAHKEHSKVDISYFDEETKERLVPHCIEPSFGVDRTVLAVLANAYAEDELGGEKRSFLKLSPKVAPYVFAVFPLLKNKPQLVERARAVYAEIRKALPGRVCFDDNGNIGKRYRRQDEVGTPWCVTVDFETLEGIKDGDNAGAVDTVTIRDRDSGEQKRVTIAEVIAMSKSVLE